MSESACHSKRCCDEPESKCCGQQRRPGCGGGRRRRARLLGRGDLQLVVLKLLESGDNHGYGLIKQLETLCGGAYAPSPGVLYPTLNLLEDQAQVVQVETAQARKSYHLTETGKELLNDRRQEAEGLLKRLAALNSVGEVQQQLDDLYNLLRVELLTAAMEPEEIAKVGEILKQTTDRITALKNDR